MKLDFDPKKNITKLDYVLTPFTKFGDFLTIRGIVKNWPDVLMFRLGLKKANFTIELRNGVKVKVSKPEDYFEFWNSEEGDKALLEQADLEEEIKIDKHKKIIKFKFLNKSIPLIYDSDKQLANTIGLIKEQFVEEQYSWLDINGKDVVDVGANIGDTAIYFTLKGAKHVYAFEPYPYSYNLALKNIKLNGLQDKITLLNEGCGGERRSIKINNNYQNFGGADLKEFDRGKEIKITNLGDIIKRFNIQYPATLKIDCEGCEYDVLLKAKDSDLSKFKQIQIEYHYGYLNLKKKLEGASFKVNKTIPKYSVNQEAENKEIFIGMIYAERE